jgi:hypothetical protein
MRSYGIRAERGGFVELSANKFDLHPTRLLTEEEKDMINNEMEDETRRESWLNEARAQLTLHERYQGVPYHQTQEDMGKLDTHEEQTRNMERADAIRPKHLPTHVQEIAAQNFCVLYTTTTFRIKKLASENMVTYAFHDANRALENLQQETAGAREINKFEKAQRIIARATSWRTLTTHY